MPPIVVCQRRRDAADITLPSIRARWTINYFKACLLQHIVTAVTWKDVAARAAVITPAAAENRKVTIIVSVHIAARFNVSAAGSLSNCIGKKECEHRTYTEDQESQVQTFHTHLL